MFVNCGENGHIREERKTHAFFSISDSNFPLLIRRVKKLIYGEYVPPLRITFTF